MKKNMNKQFSLRKSVWASWALAVTLAMAAFAFAGCQKDPEDSTGGSTGTPSITYTLSFETNGGSTIDPVSVAENGSVDVSEYVPFKEGFYFYGWTVDEELTTRAENILVMTEDTKLYAEWGEEEKYTLSFETNGGTAIESVMYRPNDYLQVPAEPTRENFSFGGWYKDAAFTQEFSFYAAPQMPKKSITIYAKWNPLNGIIFNTNGSSAIDPVFGNVGEKITVAEPTKADSIFEGWYKDAAFTTPYEITTIPSGTVTLYAKWHSQTKGVTVTLHVNYGELTTVKTLTGNEGETMDAATAVSEYTAAVNDTLKSSYLGNAADINATPIMKFSAWAYDENGANRFDGEFPHDAQVDLYAVWTRSAAYCQVSFVEDDAETAYYLKKNTVVDASVLERHTASAKATYEQLGCKVEGFYTVGGNRYVAGDEVAMDMRLLPYVYSADLVYEYVTIGTAAGAEVKGYALKGYDESKAAEYKAKDDLLLLIPEYYNDGKNGQQPVIWIADEAFAGFNVTSVTIPDDVYGIGARAFKDTTLKSIKLPSRLFYLGDEVFSGSAALSEVEFNSDVSKLGATIFSGTAYEAQMPSNDAGFIFFDSARSIIYAYKGTATKLTTPATARTIGGGAFKGNTTIKELILSDGIRYISDYAFEASAVETVSVGKFFADMGVGIFKDCKNLVSVNFTSPYNLNSFGESMFEGCTKLTDVNVSELVNLMQFKKRAFFGCTSLEKMTLGDNFLVMRESAMEGCTSLVSVTFGETDKSLFSLFENRVFANCTSLRRVILRGELINNQIVTFKAGVFAGAGYQKNGTFVTPVLYVKDNSIENWREEDELTVYTYVEIYKRSLPTEYRNLVIKAIDAKVPQLTINHDVELTASASLAQFDLLAYLASEGVYTVSDDVSSAADCVVYVSSVAKNGVKLTANGGKYDMSAKGAYEVVLTVEDECGNTAEAMVNVIVK